MTTILDIAQKTKVSRTTVSRVLNSTGLAPIPISPATRQKVLAAAKELNYHPNIAARTLRTNKTNTIGVVTAEISDPYFSDIIMGIEQVVNANRYSFLLSTVENNAEKERFYIKTFRQRQVDGILVVGCTSEIENEAVLRLVEEGIPVALITREVEDRAVPCILVDNFKGGILAAEHLIKLGHKMIVYLTGPPGKIECEDRRKGYKTALERHGLKYDQGLVVQGGNRPEQGYASVRRLLQEGRVPAAIFAYNDMMAFGAVRALEDSGLRVPENVSVVGFDDILMAAHYNPPLTTVHQPMVEMGREGASALLELLQHGKGTVAYGRKVMEPELVIRKSCSYAGR